MSNEINTSKMQNIAEQMENAVSNTLGRMREMNTIKVDTAKLDYYSNRLRSLNRQLTNVDLKLDSLLLKVNIGDKVNVLKADLSIGYNFKIAKCASYLDNCADRFRKVEKTLCGKDPLYFTKPLTKRISDEGLFGVIGKAIRTAAEDVKSAFDYTCQFIGEGIYKLQCSYLEKGTVYKVFQIGKAIFTTAKGVGKMFGGLVAIFSGAGAPIGVLSLISGFNDVYNGINRAFDAYNGDYEKLDKNLLRDALVDGGTQLGGYFGCPEVGSNIARGLYYSVDLITSIDSFNKISGSIIQTRESDLNTVSDEILEWGNQYKGYIQDKGISNFLRTNIDQLIYDFKLSGLNMFETKNVISNVGTLYGYLKKAYKVVDKGADVIFSTITGNTSETITSKTIDNMFKGIDYLKNIVGNGIPTGKKIFTTAKYIFS